MNFWKIFSHATVLWILAFGIYLYSVSSLFWPGILVVGYLQYLLLQVMHESVHQVFSRYRGWKSLVMAFLHNFSLGVGRSYSELHMDHHRYFGEAERDPDYPTYAEYPKTKLDFLRVCLSHLSGIKAILQLFQWRKKTAKSHVFDKFYMISTQFLIFSGAWYCGLPWAYLVFWILPLMTVVKVLGYLRILVEHGAPDKKEVLRSLRGNTLLCSIIGPYGFQYHAEHHKVLNIPYGELKPSSEVEVYEGSHFGFLWKMFWSLP